MHLVLKRWLHVLGALLGLAGVVFVVLRLGAYVKQIDFMRFDATACVFLGVLVLLYGAAGLLLARAWWHLLAFFEVRVKWKWALTVYGLSQLAKYVPGNIFHLAGRQALGMAAGLPAPALIKSILWELWLIVIAGALFGLLAVPLAWKELPVWASSGVFLMMSMALVVFLRHQLSPSVAAALFWQITFLALSGMVFIGTLSVVVPTTGVMPASSALCGAYVIAWLAGLITPGAPAGVGVRELVLLFLLKGVVAEADLLLTVVLGRIITVVGDFSYFMVATFIRLSRTAE